MEPGSNGAPIAARIRIGSNPFMPRYSLFGWSLWIQVFTILGVVTPLLCVSMLSVASFDLKTAAGCSVLVYSALHLAHCSASGERRLLSLTFWLFVYVWMGVAPVLQVASASYPWGGSYPDATVLGTYGTLLLGLICYDMGGVLVASFPTSTTSAWSLFNRVVVSKRVFILAAVGVVVLAPALYYLGGFSILFSSRIDAVQTTYQRTDKTMALVMSTLLRVPVFIACLLLYYIEQTGARRNTRQRILLLGLFVLNLLVSNPISTARYWFGTVVLSFAFMRARWNRHWSFVAWMSALLGLLIIVFPYADLFRATTAPVIRLASVSEQLVNKPDYDAFQMLMNTVQYVNTSGTTHGSQFLGAVLFWVPRSLWPGKPAGSCQYVAEHIGYAFTNLSCPLWAEGHINGGLLGVAALLGCYGALSAVLEQRFLRHTSELTLTKVMVPLLAAYQMFLVRGDLLNGIAYGAPMVLAVYICSQSAGKPERATTNGER